MEIKELLFRQVGGKCVDVVLTSNAQEAIVRHVAEMRGLETGGLLVGSYDTHEDGRRTLRIVQAWDAPPDSTHAERQFHRGIVGQNEALTRAYKESDGRHILLGEWHCHPPGQSAYPSQADHRALMHTWSCLDGQYPPGLEAVAVGLIYCDGAYCVYVVIGGEFDLLFQVGK